MKWAALKRLYSALALFLAFSPLAFSDTGAKEKTYTITETELSTLKNALQNALTEIESLKKTLQAQEKELNELRSLLEESKNQLTMLSNELNESRKKIEALQNQLIEQKKSLEALLKSLEELKKENERIKSERDTAIFIGAISAVGAFLLGILLF